LMIPFAPDPARGQVGVNKVSVSSVPLALYGYIRRRALPGADIAREPDRDLGRARIVAAEHTAERVEERALGEMDDVLRQVFVFQA